MVDYSIHTKDMAVGYHGNTLICDICIGVHPGEIVTLIGPNGSGKSTILKSMTRQLRLLGGDVLVDDLSLNKINAENLAKKMSVVLTENIHPEMMSCYEVAAMGRYPYTGRLGILSGEDHRKVREALEMVEAHDLSNCPFDSVSDGQRQRILLARALCQEPEIIVLDEPTSFLDIHHKLKLLSVLKKMTEEKGIAVLMSLHEIDLAQKISDKIVGVKGEKIACYGSPEKIFKDEIIKELYNIDNGSYDPYFGSIELPTVTGDAQVFVISSGGTGIPVYRKLQKENIPFAAGILYKNDIDYQLAMYLASEVVVEEPFQKISDKAYEQAKACIAKCGRVINAGVVIGDCNRRIEALIEAAAETGKLFPYS